MTRKSKREIERAVDDLAGDGGEDPGLTVLYRDGRTGEHYRDRDMAGDPVDPDEIPGLVVEIAGRGGVCIMMREQAEREGYDILGPAEDAPADDAVRVVRED